MVTLRFAVPAILTAAVVAACLSYFVIITLPARLENDARLLNVRLPVGQFDAPSPSAAELNEVDQPSKEDELAAAAFQRAAEQILRRAPNSRASAFTNELPMTGQIPLPRKRPIAR
jgi:hypothetical protein